MRPRVVDGRLLVLPGRFSVLPYELNLRVGAVEKGHFCTSAEHE